MAGRGFLKSGISTGQSPRDSTPVKIHSQLYNLEHLAYFHQHSLASYWVVRLLVAHHTSYIRYFQLVNMSSFKLPKMHLWVLNRYLIVNCTMADALSSTYIAGLPGTQKIRSEASQHISPSTMKSLYHYLTNDSILRILSIINIRSSWPILRFRNRTNNFRTN